MPKKLSTSSGTLPKLATSRTISQNLNLSRNMIAKASNNAPAGSNLIHGK